MGGPHQSLVSIYRSFGPVDLKNVRRDDLLVWIVALVFLMVLLLRFGAPALTAVLQQRLGFDLTAYYGLVMSGFVGIAPGIAGLVIGFLLLDERDDRTLTALLVTPMPVTGYLLYRVTAPFVLGFVITAATYPLVGLAPLSLPDLLAVAALASFGGPLTALFLAIFAENKIAGLALVKVLNTINMIPVLAYFVRSEWQLVAGLVPAYWPMKMVWLATTGEGYALYAVVGLAVNVVALAVLLRRFNTVLHR